MHSVAVQPRPALSPPARTGSLEPGPEVLAVLVAANVEDGGEEAGHEAPDADTDIIVDNGDN